MFSLESLEEHYSTKTSIIQELRTHISFLRNFDPTSGNQFGEEALMILASKFTARGVYLLKAVIELVPKTYSMKLSEFGGISWRTQLINEITSASDTPVVSLNQDELEFTVNSMESYCVQFLSMGEPLEQNKLLEISKRSKYRLTKFLAPPVRTCLCCEGNLTMHNWPTRARLFSLEGPVPASKIALECRNCKISYGLA